MILDGVELWIAKHWDRQAFFAFMRRVEILLLQNLQDQAVEAFRAYRAWTRPDAPTMESPVADVLPTKLANALRLHGYETLQAAAMARPYELRAIPHVGEKAEQLIQAAAEAARQGQRLPEVVAQWASELEPDFEVDWDYFTQFKPKWDALLKYINTSPERQTMSTGTYVSTETNSQLAVLLKSIENPEQTVAQIDEQIAKREAELAKLKKLRKLLAAKPTARDNPRTFAEVETKILDAVKRGPLKPREIKKSIGVDAAHIGRVVARSLLLVKLSDGRIQAKGK